MCGVCCSCRCYVCTYRLFRSLTYFLSSVYMDYLLLSVRLFYFVIYIRYTILNDKGAIPFIMKLSSFDVSFFFYYFITIVEVSRLRGFVVLLFLFG